MPFGIGHWEIVILAVVILLLFGGSQFPRIARQLGRGARQARSELAELKQGFDVDAKAERERAEPTHERANVAEPNK